MKTVLIITTALIALSLGACDNKPKASLETPAQAGNVPEKLKEISTTIRNVEKTTVPGTCTDKTLDQAALRVLYPKIGGRGYLTGLGEEQRQERELKKLRTWATSEVKDPCTQAAYLKWIEYYENDLADIRKMHAQDRLVAEKAKTLPRPPA